MLEHTLYNIHDFLTNDFRIHISAITAQNQIQSCCFSLTLQEKRIFSITHTVHIKKNIRCWINCNIYTHISTYFH